LAVKDERKIVKCTLELLLKAEEVSAGILDVVYENVSGWDVRAAEAGLRLLGAHFDSFLTVVAQFGVGPLVECILERERAIKIRAFELLIEIDRHFALTDLAILEALVELADDVECAPLAVEMVTAIHTRLNMTGRGADFISAVAEFDQQLSDLELSGNDLVALLSRELRTSLLNAQAS
jgi:hypothetical protein